MAYIIVVNPEHPQPGGDGMGRRLPRHHHRLHYRHAGDGAMLPTFPMRRRPAWGSTPSLSTPSASGLALRWQQALSMVFICGLINILDHGDQAPASTIIKLDPGEPAERHRRRYRHLCRLYRPAQRRALLRFDSGVPALATLHQPSLWLFLIGLALTIVLLA